MRLDEFFRLGETVELGSHTFEAEAIKAFARKYDPQPFHVDEEAAKKSVLGGLCASGWHTAAAWMKCNIADAAGPRMGRPGAAARIRPVARLQEPQMAEAGLCRRDGPLHPHLARPSRARLAAEGWRLLSMRAEGFNSTGDKVIEFDSAVLVKVG